MTLMFTCDMYDESGEYATGMEYVLEIMESDQVNECYMKRETQGYVGTLY